VSERINDGNSNVIIIRILNSEQHLMIECNDGPTEYEFSPTCEEPVARILGE